MKLLLAIIGVVLISAATLCNSQSLGDAAREQKSRKATSPVAKRAPVTNDDIAPAAPDRAKDAAEKEPPASDRKASTASSRSAAAAEFKARIKAQKQRVNILELQMKELQKKLDTWKTSDCTHLYHPGDPYGNACDVPPKLTAAYGMAKTQLDKERGALEALQDKARRAGFGVTVYDPD